MKAHLQQYEEVLIGSLTKLNNNHFVSAEFENYIEFLEIVVIATG